MKNRTTQLLPLILFIFVPLLSFGQEITGTWSGTLKVQGAELRLVFHIDQKDGSLGATMDSPDQGAKGIPVDSVIFDDPKLRIKINNAGIQYDASLTDNTLKGTFQQSGLTIPLDMKRTEEEND